MWGWRELQPLCAKPEHCLSVRQDKSSLCLAFIVLQGAEKLRCVVSDMHVKLMHALGAPLYEALDLDAQFGSVFFVLFFFLDENIRL